MSAANQSVPPAVCRACWSGTLVAVRQPRLKSTFARATVPVAAGIGFFALLAALLWGVAALISRNTDQVTNNLSPTTQELGNAESLAEVIRTDGPIILNDLLGNDDHLVVTHSGDDPTRGWAIYLAHPADRDLSCPVEVVKGTQTFLDCDGRTLTVDDLALVPDYAKLFYNEGEGTITISLRP